MADMGDLEGKWKKEIERFNGPATGMAELPGSKSLTNRALVCAMLCSPKTKITLKGALRSDDTEAMLIAARTLGDDPANVQIDEGDGGTTISLPGIFTGPAQSETPVEGATEIQKLLDEGKLNRINVDEFESVESIDANKAGTVARFLLPMLAARDGGYALDSHEQLRSRPLSELVEALGKIGADVFTRVDHPKAGEKVEGSYIWPIIIHGQALKNGKDLPGGALEISANQSSQFLSGLLLAAPSFKDGLTVRLSNADTAVSKPYIDMTVKVMEAFGATVTKLDSNTYEVAPGGYLPDEPATLTYAIEPDATAASYFWAAAAITGGEVRVEGLSFKSLQGDVRFAKVLEEMGCEVTEEVLDESTAITVRGPAEPNQLRGGEFDLSDISDTTQTLAVVAAFANSPVTITGVGFIRRKESDRIGFTVKELNKRGIKATEHDDGMGIEPGPSQRKRIKSGHVETYEDHRMAMSMSLLGLKVGGIVIDGAECVGKTFPDFFEALEKLVPPPASPSLAQQS